MGHPVEKISNSTSSLERLLLQKAKIKKISNGCCEREWLDFGLCRNNRNAKMLNGCIYMKGKDRGGRPDFSAAMPQCSQIKRVK